MPQLESLTPGFLSALTRPFLTLHRYFPSTSFHFTSPHPTFYSHLDNLERYAAESRLWPQRLLYHRLQSSYRPHARQRPIDFQQQHPRSLGAAHPLGPVSQGNCCCTAAKPLIASRSARAVFDTSIPGLSFPHRQAHSPPVLPLSATPFRANVLERSRAVINTSTPKVSRVPRSSFATHSHRRLASNLLHPTQSTSAPATNAYFSSIFTSTPKVSRVPQLSWPRLSPSRLRSRSTTHRTNSTHTASRCSRSTRPPTLR
jgi:hypothetical protein